MLVLYRHLEHFCCKKIMAKNPRFESNCLPLSEWESLAANIIKILFFIV